MWVRRWGYEVAEKATRPGIYRLKAGGFLVRGRVTDPKTGKRRTVIKALREAATAGEAQAALDRLMSERRDEVTGKKPSRRPFATFATSRFEAKVRGGDIKSAKGREKWAHILACHIVPHFGTLACEEIRPWHVEAWRDGIAKKIAEGYTATRKLKNGKTDERHVVLSPRTANTWIAVARTLFGEMVRLLELPSNPATGLRPFDTSQRPTYTDEEPNALTPEQARPFLDRMREVYPQHYAMTLLGFVTGKRPSTLRPLRAEGEEADVDWEEGFIRFRRSHTQGDEVMAGTKTGTRERVYLPEMVMQVLREHRALIKSPPLNARGKGPLWWRKQMAESPLLFPARDGGMRSPSCLDKAFLDVSRAIGLPFEVTPRAMRRTCNDLCRAAEVSDVVTRSITGHLTERMTAHYSTAGADEQRSALGKVISLVTTEGCEIGCEEEERRSTG